MEFSRAVRRAGYAVERQRSWGALGGSRANRIHHRARPLGRRESPAPASARRPPRPARRRRAPAGAGMFAGFPFALGRPGGRRHGAFARCLGPTHLRPIAVHLVPFPTSVHFALKSVFATLTMICTRGCST